MERLNFRPPTEEEKKELVQDPVIRKAIDLGGVVAGVREVDNQEESITSGKSSKKK